MRVNIVFVSYNCILVATCVCVHTICVHVCVYVRVCGDKIGLSPI